VRSLCLGELSQAELDDVLAVPKQRIARQEGFQDLLAFKQRFFADVLAVHEQRVKNDIE
jgi:hypothetical protein